MSKFKKGDQVKVTQITDIDAEPGKPGRIITDPTHEYTMDWRNPPQTLIGQVGIVIEPSMNDYYDCMVRFPWNAENEDLAMVNDDLELVDNG